MTTANILSQLGSPGVSTGFKNRIINGAMVIDQRNGGASVTVNTDPLYTLDRWRCAKNGTINNFTCQQSSTAPVGFANSMVFTAGTGVTPVSTDYAAATTVIEGYNIADFNWGSANAKTVTVSFWVQSSLTGNFGGSIRSGSGASRSYVFSYTINTANTWEYKTVTIPGDTGGTYPNTNAAGLSLNFDLGVGPTYSGAVTGSWVASNLFGLTGGVKLAATTGSTWYVTGVQLEVGTTATNFDVRSYGTELALCQRYCYKVSSTSSYTRYGNGANPTGSTSDPIVFFPTAMRAPPSLTIPAVSQFALYGGTSIIPCQSLTLDTATLINASLYVTVNSGLTAGGCSDLMANNNTTSYLLFSAEL
jgi:hypothetical protein